MYSLNNLLFLDHFVHVNATWTSTDKSKMFKQSWISPLQSAGKW